MEMKILKNYMVIAELGSISRAAAALHMSQPPLTMQMQQLEAELGIKLFVRTSKGVSLTEHGKILYDKGQILLNYASSIEAELKGDKEEIVNIGITSSSINFSIPLMGEFLKEKNCRFSITEKNTIELLSLLEKRLLDIAIIRTPFSTDMPFKKILLGKGGLAAIGIPHLFDNQSNTLSLTDLSGLPLITISRWKNYFDRALKNSDISLQYKIICGDNRTSYSMAKKGLGVAIIPFTGSGPDISDSLDVKIISDEIANTDIYLIYDELIKKNSATTKFIKFAEAQLNKL